MIDRFAKYINAIYNDYVIKRNQIKVGKNLKIRGRLYILGKKIELGNNISVNSGAKYNPIGGSAQMQLITYGEGKILIGNNVGMSNSCIVATNLVIIEDDVLIGGSCKIYDTDFHSLEYEHRMQRPDQHIKTAPVLIKRGAFIGAHSVILKGVTVGEKSVIGAGSVVTKDIPDGEVWAGNPAKFIKRISKGGGNLLSQ